MKQNKLNLNYSRTYCSLNFSQFSQQLTVKFNGIVSAASNTRMSQLTYHL